MSMFVMKGRGARESEGRGPEIRRRERRRNRQCWRRRKKGLFMRRSEQMKDGLEPSDALKISTLVNF